MRFKALFLMAVAIALAMVFLPLAPAEASVCYDDTYLPAESDLLVMSQATVFATDHYPQVEVVNHRAIILNIDDNPVVTVTAEHYIDTVGHQTARVLSAPKPAVPLIKRE